MAAARAEQRFTWLRRIENRLGEGALILHREPDDLRLLNRPMRRLLRGGGDKTTHASALDLSGAFDDR